MIEELKNDGKNSVIIYYREYDNAQDDRHSTPTPRTKAFRDAPSLNDTSVYEQISLQRFQEIVQAIKSEIHTAKSHFHEISKPLPPPFESAKPKKIKKPVRKK